MNFLTVDAIQSPRIVAEAVTKLGSAPASAHKRRRNLDMESPFQELIFKYWPTMPIFTGGEHDFKEHVQEESRNIKETHA